MYNSIKSKINDLLMISCPGVHQRLLENLDFAKERDNREDLECEFFQENDPCDLDAHGYEDEIREIQHRIITHYAI